MLAGQWKTLISPSLRRALISWIAHVIAPDKGIDTHRLNTEDLAEVQIMLATRIKQWEQEILQKGIEKGLLSGEAVMLRRLLQLRFGELPTWVDERFEQATREDLECWCQRILDARSLSEVFG